MTGVREHQNHVRVRWTVRTVWSGRERLPLPPFDFSLDRSLLDSEIIEICVRWALFKKWLGRSALESRHAPPHVPALLTQVIKLNEGGSQRTCFQATSSLVTKYIARGQQLYSWIKIDGLYFIAPFKFSMFRDAHKLQGATGKKKKPTATSH